MSNDTLVIVQDDSETLLSVDHPGVISSGVEDFRIVAAEENSTAVSTVSTDMFTTSGAAQGPVGAQGIQGIQGIPGAALSTVVSRINDDVVGLPFGTPVYFPSGTTVKRAAAGNVDAKDVAGLVYDSYIDTTMAGQIMCSGILTGTTAQWDAVTDSVGGLSPNQEYFLGANSGKITLYPITIAPGSWLCMIGQALSPTEMLIRVEPPIRL